MYRLESQRENRKGKKKELLDYMWENYEITYHQAKQRIDLDETQSLTKVKETISELKNKIKNLGPVNINAVEDYKEVSERYEFMQKQHEDIVTAEAHLTGLMEERKMRCAVSLMQSLKTQTSISGSIRGIIWWWRSKIGTYR